MQWRTRLPSPRRRPPPQHMARCFSKTLHALSPSGPNVRCALFGAALSVGRTSRRYSRLCCQCSYQRRKWTLCLGIELESIFDCELCIKISKLCIPIMISRVLQQQQVQWILSWRFASAISRQVRRGSIWKSSTRPTVSTDMGPFCTRRKREWF